MNNQLQRLIEFNDGQWTIDIIRDAFDNLVEKINQKVCPHRLLVNERNQLIYRNDQQCQCQLLEQEIYHTKLGILKYLLSRSDQLTNIQRLEIFNQQIPYDRKAQFPYNPNKTNIYIYKTEDVNLQQILRLKRINDDYRFRYFIFNYEKCFRNFHLILIQRRHKCDNFNNFTEFKLNLTNFVMFLQLAAFNGIHIKVINHNSLYLGDRCADHQLNIIQICHLENTNFQIYSPNENIEYKILMQQLGQLIKDLTPKNTYQHDNDTLIPLQILSEHLLDGSINSLNSVIQFLNNGKYLNIEPVILIQQKEDGYVELALLHFNRLVYRIYFIHKTIEHCRQYVIEREQNNYGIYHKFCLLLYKNQDQTIREFLNLFPSELSQFTKLTHFYIHQQIQCFSINDLHPNNIQYQGLRTEILQYINQGQQNNLQLQIKLRLRLILSSNFDYYIRLLYFTKTDQIFRFAEQEIRNWENIQQNLDPEIILDFIELLQMQQQQ